MLQVESLVYAATALNGDHIANRIATQPGILIIPPVAGRVTPAVRALVITLIKGIAGNYTLYTSWYRTALLLCVIPFKSLEYAFYLNIQQHPNHQIRRLTRLVLTE